MLPLLVSLLPADAKPQEDSVNLPDVLTNEVLRPLSSDPSVRSQVESHLPPTSEEPEVVLTSPQFQQALGTFGSALQSGQLGPLMNQFGFGGQVVSAADSGSTSVVWLVVKGTMCSSGGGFFCVKIAVAFASMEILVCTVICF